MSNYGKFFIDRKIFESDIWEKPSHYLKIWIWIIGRANWKEVKKGGQIFPRGSFKTSYDTLIKENEHFEGAIKRRLTKDQVYFILKFLRKTNRITTRKTTRGLWIIVTKYDYFQQLPKPKAAPHTTPHTTTERQLYDRDKRKKEKKEKREGSVSPRSTDSPISSSKTQPPSEASHNDHKEKGKDPVKEVTDFFCKACENIRNFKPRISWKIEIKMIKDYLKEYSVDDLTDELDWFLKSEECDKLGCTIKIALSTYVFNKWQNQREVYH